MNRGAVILAIILVLHIPFSQVSTMQLTASPQNETIKHQMIDIRPKLPRVKNVQGHVDPMQDISTSNVIIEDQPGVIIDRNNYENQSLTLINSPNAVIRNSIFHHLTGDNQQVAITLINSPNTTIVDTTIDYMISNQNTSIGIYIESSNNIVIRNTSISRISSLTSKNISETTSAIYLKDSNSTSFINNFITQIYGRLPFAIFTDNTHDIKIQGNVISETSAKGNDTESAGIVVEGSNNGKIIDNHIELIYSSADSRSTSFGVTIQNSKSITLDRNRIEKVSTTSDDPNAFGIHAARSNNLVFLQNIIRTIEAQTENYGESYSTGIYLALVNNVNISQNLIVDIYNNGQASYGFFIDKSPYINTTDNLITNIRSQSTQSTISSGITARQSPYFIAKRNIIEQVHSTKSGGSEVGTISSIAIFVTVSHDSLILHNSLRNISAIDTKIEGDVIGVYLHNSDRSIIESTQMTAIHATGNSKGIAIGITISSSRELEVLGNLMSDLSSMGTAFGIFQETITRSLIKNNVIHQVNSNGGTYGHYIFLSSITKLEANSITNLVSNAQSITYQVSFSYNISIVDGYILDNTHNDRSRGFYITGGTGHKIINNKIYNKHLWIELQTEEIEIECVNNMIDDHTVDNCQDIHHLRTTSMDSMTTEHKTANQSVESSYYLLYAMILASLLIIGIFRIRRKNDT